MGDHAGRIRESFTRRHPVVAFLGLLLAVSVLAESLAAGIHGGWSTWGDSILWYRISCVVNNVVIGVGAYVFVRWFRGPHWWRYPRARGWSLFVGITALQSLFLLILTRQFATLYGGDTPPMATDWLPAFSRVLVPLLCLYWVRLQYVFSVDRGSPTPSHNYP